jgi:hypothetical protein
MESNDLCETSGEECCNSGNSTLVYLSGWILSLKGYHVVAADAGTGGKCACSPLVQWTE